MVVTVKIKEVFSNLLLHSSLSPSKLFFDSWLLHDFVSAGYAPISFALSGTMWIFDFPPFSEDIDSVHKSKVELKITADSFLVLKELLTCFYFSMVKRTNHK